MQVSPLTALVVEVEDVDRALGFYNDLLGLGLHRADNGGDDRWMSGDHAEISWTQGGYFHFALYKSKGVVTRNVQLAFMTDDLDAMHRKLEAAGVEIAHGPREEPWGRTARYFDPD